MRGISRSRLPADDLGGRPTKRRIHPLIGVCCCRVGQMVLLGLALLLSGCSQGVSTSHAKGREEHESAESALASARGKLDDQDYAAAFDFLLAAMRAEPSSPTVFAADL